MAREIILKFDGLEAAAHHLPMFQLAQSLLGTDRIFNSALIFFATGRQPKRGERFDLVVTAKAPRPGSYEIVTILHHTPYLLPVLQDFMVTGGVDAAYRLAGYLLTKAGGRPVEAQMHLDAMVQMNRDHLEARNRNEEQWRATLLAVVDRLLPSAKQMVRPIGDSATDMTLAIPDLGQTTTVDEPMADAIRSNEDDEVLDMQAMEIQVDGITHHSRQLKIVHPSIEGRFITADVRDPMFDNFPNAYTEAASNLSKLKVQAKPVLRNGELYKIYIMDLIRE